VPILEARHLTKHFAVLHAGRAGGAGRTRLRRPHGGTVVHAVEDVSLALAPAKVTAVVGESGSGKSTLARMLARLVSPTNGEILLDGHAASGHRREYARQVQMVLQDPFASLNPVHDVRYHLARPLLAHGLARRAELDDVITGLLERVALTPGSQFLRKYPHELSGGQRQRVAIARALALNPRLVVMDEAVSALDVLVQEQILELMVSLQRELGLSYLFISHDLAVVRQVSHLVYVMREGKIVESGDPDTIFRAPREEYTRQLIAAIPGQNLAAA
jgi:peptide/nickel transport system ATP-binding protein